MEANLNYSLAKYIRMISAVVSLFSIVSYANNTIPIIDKSTLASAMRMGDLKTIKRYISAGGNINLSWKDTPFTVKQSLILRAVWYGKEDIFKFLIEKGADVSPIQEYIHIPIRAGRLNIVKPLLAKKITIPNNRKILEATLKSKNLPMTKLVTSQVPTIWDNPSLIQMANYFAPGVVRFLVPKYISPNQDFYIGDSSCQAPKLVFPNKETEGCEGTIGPLWMHYVLLEDTGMLKFFLKHKVDLNKKVDEFISTGENKLVSALDLAKLLKNNEIYKLLSGKK